MIRDSSFLTSDSHFTAQLSLSIHLSLSCHISKYQKCEQHTNLQQMYKVKTEGLLVGSTAGSPGGEI